jgi:hypothetical protein
MTCSHPAFSALSEVSAHKAKERRWFGVFRYAIKRLFRSVGTRITNLRSPKETQLLGAADKRKVRYQAPSLFSESVT